jgi:hypothetical protein
MAELGQVDPSFVARYGRVITRRGVAAVPRAMFTHQAALGLTPQQVWFVTYIFSFQWDTALPYPSIRKMSNVTGYSSVQLHTIKAELVSKGFLRLVHRANEQGGQDTNAYDFSGLLDKVRELLGGPADDNPPDKPRIGESEKQTSIDKPAVRRRGRRVRSEAREGDSIALSTGDSIQFAGEGRIRLSGRGSRELTTEGSVDLSGEDSIQFAGEGRGKLTSEGRTELPGGNGGKLAGPGNGTHAGGTSVRYARGVARGLHESESPKEEAEMKKDDSNQRSRRDRFTKNENESKAAAPPYSPYIASVVSDFSNELNDPAHVISNVTQALRLWQVSGVDEEQFTELLYEAKRITRSYQGKQGLNGMNNKMAYFFKVVRDLCSPNGERGPSL